MLIEEENLNFIVNSFQNGGILAKNGQAHKIFGQNGPARFVKPDIYNHAVTAFAVQLFPENAFCID